MSFTLKGSKQMQKAIRDIAADVSSRIAPALRMESELIMTESKQKYVPVDLGVLRSSGYIQAVETSYRQGRRFYSITFGYGGAAKAYAIAVHENPSTFDPPSWKGTTVNFRNGRGRKYLETPLRKAQADMAERIAKRLEIRK